MQPQTRTQSSGGNNLLEKFLQNDQLGVIYNLHKGCKYSLEPQPEWNWVQQRAYPEFCLLAATFSAIADIVLYPLIGVGRVCSVLITWDSNDFSQGIKDITIGTLESLALSIYLLGLSAIGLINQKAIFDDIHLIVEEKASGLWPQEKNQNKDPSDLANLSFADIGQMNLKKLSPEELVKLIENTRDTLEFEEDALREKVEDLKKATDRVSKRPESSFKTDNENKSGVPIPPPPPLEAGAPTPPPAPSIDPECKPSENLKKRQNKLQQTLRRNRGNLKKTERTHERRKSESEEQVASLTKVMKDKGVIQEGNGEEEEKRDVSDDFEFNDHESKASPSKPEEEDPLKKKLGSIRGSVQETLKSPTSKDISFTNTPFPTDLKKLKDIHNKGGDQAVVEALQAAGEPIEIETPGSRRRNSGGRPRNRTNSGRGNAAVNKNGKK